MVRDLDLDIDIRGVPTVREPDGLAMSSRNRYLSVEERQAAASIPRALEEARRVMEGGERDSGVVAEAVRKVLSAEPLVDVEYVVVADAETLEELSAVRGDGSALVQVAVRIGRARLIDHVLL
jgi:pantoate--beta-alanine ligase